MDSKSIIAGLFIGAIIGGFMGFLFTPSPDISDLNLQIDQLQQQVVSLENSLDDRDRQIDSLNIEIDRLEAQVVLLGSEVQRLRASTNITLVVVSFSRTEDTSYLLQRWIERANETIRLMVMLITHDELADALVEAHNRGVDIDVLIDDGWLYSTGSDYEKILDSGIDIRGDSRGGLMHHKVMIIDGCVVVTGSYNWSASAEDSNDENIIIIRSASLAQIYLVEFNRLWDQT